MPIKQLKWSKADEKSLKQYVKSNITQTGQVNWQDIQLIFPDKTISQITSKYFRMKNDEAARWDFSYEANENTNTQSENYQEMIQNLLVIINKMDNEQNE